MLLLWFVCQAAPDSQHTNLVFQNGSLSVGQGPWVWGVQGGIPRYQEPRVSELWQAGAQVFLCKSPGPKGSFHCKAVVVDRRYLYCGGPYFSYKSQNNAELCWWIAGPAVGQVLQN